MSSFKIRRLPVTHAPEARLPEPQAQPHPRGKGFGILSRIARVETDEVVDYEPRHRRDVPADAETPATD